MIKLPNESVRLCVFANVLIERAVITGCMNDIANDALLRAISSPISNVIVQTCKSLFPFWKYVSRSMVVRTQSLHHVPRFLR